MRSTPHYLTITALLCAASIAPTVSAQAPAVTDAEIVANVKNVLTSEHALQGQTITPASIHGILTLSGTVTSEAAKVLASIEAGQVNGVKSVLNNLVISGSSAPAPHDSAITTKSIILSSGTMLPIRLQEELTSKTAKKNDHFHGTVINNVYQQGVIVIPAGTPVLGRVVEAKPAPIAFGFPALAIELLAIQLPSQDGLPQNDSLVTDALTSKGAGHGSSTLGATGVGGIGFGGTGGNALAPGQNIMLRPETILRFHTTAALSVTVYMRNGIQLPLTPTPGPAALPATPTASLSFPQLF